MCAGGPCVTNNSASAASTPSLRSRRATGRARHSLLASSMIDRVRNLRPSCVRPSTDSERSGEGQAKRAQLVRQHMTWILGPQPHTRSVIEPEPAPLRLLLRDLEAFTAPSTLEPFAVHMPACIAQQSRHPAIAVATVLPRQGDDVLRECGFVIRPTRRFALRRSMLPDNTANPPLRHRHRAQEMIDTAPAERGAQKFPRAASCRISLSSVRSDIARRNRSFSVSSSLATPPFGSSAEPGPSSDHHTPYASGSSSARQHRCGDTHQPPFRPRPARSQLHATCR